MDAWVWVVLETWSRKEGGGEGRGREGWEWA